MFIAACSYIFRFFSRKDHASVKHPCSIKATSEAVSPCSYWLEIFKEGCLNDETLIRRDRIRYSKCEKKKKEKKVKKWRDKMSKEWEAILKRKERKMRKKQKYKNKYTAAVTPTRHRLIAVTPLLRSVQGLSAARAPWSSGLAQRESCSLPGRLTQSAFEWCSHRGLPLTLKTTRHTTSASITVLSTQQKPTFFS